MSSAVCLVQNLLEVPINYCRLRYGIFALHWIDDVFTPRRLQDGTFYPNHLEALYLELGLIINEEKSTYGAELDFTGFRLNLALGTFEICAKTLDKTLKSLATRYLKEGSNYLHFSFDELESLLGRLNFLCEASHLGRTRTSGLNRCLRVAHAASWKEVPLLTPGYDELHYWTDFCRRPDVLRFSRPDHFFYHLYMSDASLSNWAYKRLERGKPVSSAHGQFPPALTGKGIFEKETYCGGWLLPI